jgi:hypothetical protein
MNHNILKIDVKFLVEKKMIRKNSLGPRKKVWIGDLKWNGIWDDKNRCLECGVNMGDCNPRQLCRKTYCPYEGMNYYEVQRLITDYFPYVQKKIELCK